MDNPSKSEEIKNKIRESNYKRFGVNNFFHTKKYLINGKRFDSSWEIYYYYYLIDNKIKFKEQVPIEYRDSRGNSHTYFCDFLIEDSNTLVEIKNPKCLDSNNNLLPYRESEKATEEYLDILKCKSECMRNNNVMIITDIRVYRNLFKKNHYDLYKDYILKK